MLCVDEDSGAVQNFVGIHKGSTESPTGMYPISTAEWPESANSFSETEKSDLKARMMVEFEHFHPNIAHIIRSVKPHETIMKTLTEAKRCPRSNKLASIRPRASSYLESWEDSSHRRCRSPCKFSQVIDCDKASRLMGVV